jgi:hypothetical protein
MSKFHIGQSVYCLKKGAGVVNEFSSLNNYPVSVSFLKNGEVYQQSYTADGCYHIGDLTPMLYPYKPQIIVPDKWIPEPNQWCLFWDGVNPNRVLLRRFVRMDVLGAVYVDNIGELFDNCIPFTGDVPKHLKGGENE